MRAHLIASAAVLALAVVACSGQQGDGPLKSSLQAGTGAPTATAATAPPAPGTGSGPPLGLASYNINAGMKGNAATLAAIRALSADVILLQEVTREWWALIDALPEKASSHPHRKVILDPRHHYGGLAILSRHPITSGEILRDGPGPFIAWRGVLDTPLGEIQVVNVHLFPPVVWFRERGIMRAYRDSQARHVEELQAHVAHLASMPTVIGGDFNESRSGDGARWLIENGFAPAHPGRQATWRWRLEGGAEVEFQLDHLMLKGLVASETAVLSEGDSDHLPITATVTRAE